MAAPIFIILKRKWDWPIKQLTILSNATDADALAEQLTEQGALAVSMTDAEDQPLFQITPDEQPLWNHVKITALFSEETNSDAVITQLALSPETQYQTETLEDQDWVRLTQENFPPQCYNGNLWVCPNWHDASKLSGTIVKIDPGLAFGTGTHPTTSLCLSWLSEHPPVNQIVIDYGCGSGILSLAALALGADKVFAVDHDEQALEATHNNAQLNAFVTADNLSIHSPEKCPTLQSPYIIANILANPLIELSDTLTSLTANQGILILSGLLEPEVERVMAAYQKDFELIDQANEDGWSRLTLKLSS